MKIQHLLALVLVNSMVISAAAAHDYQVGELKIEHPWARPTVPGQSAGGAFLSVNNTGRAADRLLGGTSPAAAKVEVHEMRMDGDVMRMRELTALELPAGKLVKLAPGGLHVMLVGLKAPLRIGDKVALKLRFEKAGEIDLILNIESKPAAPDAPAHKH